MIFTLSYPLNSHSQVVASTRLAIVYDRKALHPKVEEIYADIISGIRDGASDYYSVIEVSNGSLQGWFADTAVLLGNYMVREALASDLKTPIVVGAVSWATEPVHGVHITVDPSLVFETMTVLIPSIKRVYIVLDANSRVLDIEDLVSSGKQYGIQVVVQLATDIKDAAGLYSRLSGRLQNDDALWIPPGDRFVNKALLSTLLLRSWRSGYAVISSNPSHVSKGALFALSPDYYLMGKRLGELAKKIFIDPSVPAKMRPLRDVKLNINQRMANHMGIKIVSSMQQKHSDKSIQIQVQ